VQRRRRCDSVVELLRQACRPGGQASMAPGCSGGSHSQAHPRTQRCAAMNKRRLSAVRAPDSGRKRPRLLLSVARHLCVPCGSSPQADAGDR